MFPSNRKNRCVAFLNGGVWTIRHGYGATRGTPVGRQFASGSLADNLDSINFLASGSSGIVSPGARPCARSPTGPPPCQTPDRSMLPSGKRGAGPVGTGGCLFEPVPAGAVGAGDGVVGCWAWSDNAPRP